MTFVDLWRYRAYSQLARVLVLLVALFAVTEDSFAGQLKLAWDAVSGAAGYRLYYGTSSGNYSSNVDAQSQTSATVTGLTDGARYYFAVKAYNGTTTSSFSGEVNAVVPAAAPVASFTASPTTGTAPLVVTLNDTSSGSITSRSWNLGDGTTSTTKTVSKTYSNPGTYAVTLTVTGSGGSTTANRSISVAAPTTTSSGGTTSGGTTSEGTTSGGTTSGGTTSGGTTSGGTTSGGTTTTTTTTSAAHTRGLVAAFGFEEPSGSGAIDASGMRNNGTISGAARVATTFFGRALKFDGNNDWVTIADNVSLDLSKGMTMAAWVFPTTTTGVRDILIKEGSGVDIYNLYARNWRGRPESNVFVGGANRVAEGTALPANVWTHVAGTYDGTTLRLFINGVQTTSSTFSGAIATSSGPLRIGGNSVWGEFFQGYIDEVRVYNRALTQAEIALDSKKAVVNLVMSKSSNRSNPVPLNGLAVSGTIYIYYALISPNAASNPVRSVAFWLDNPTPENPTGSPRKVEFAGPFDFAGTDDSGEALGFDTTKLSKGIHTISARVTLRDGTVLPFVGTFTVQ
jgi:PKD repeat protein